MSRRMTVVFHDEELYTTLKVEAARRHKPASDIITEAVQQWLESHEVVKLLKIVPAGYGQATDLVEKPAIERTAESYASAVLSKATA